ncbi:MAG TPA: HlyD family type I secretion periplasmic adaptor subunit, partial [Xanthobacteraceae bacterium]|nr:HlyD family type I secretion periplasmic adaptor subunit [Xanthobacteraceae bacterium]
MPHDNDVMHLQLPSRRPRQQRKRGPFDAQENALIQELRKLQSAFDREFHDRSKRGRSKKERVSDQTDETNAAQNRAEQNTPTAALGNESPKREPILNIKIPNASELFRMTMQWSARVSQISFKQIKIWYDFLLNRSSRALSEELSGSALSLRVISDFERHLRNGLRVLVFGVGFVGIWATLVPLSGAVVVPGNLVVETSAKKIQHPTGGIVAEIPVHDGKHVNQGDLVLRLDETQARANLQVISTQLDEIRVRIARLAAERDDAGEPAIPASFSNRPGNKDLEQLVASERALFKARSTTRASQKELLRSHIGQLREEITGLNAQLKSRADQLELINSELQGIQSLYDKRLVPLTRLTALQREAARLDGERGQSISAIAETQSKISEAELHILRVDQDFRAEVMKDLRESQAKEAELAERSIAARDQLNRIEMRAPTSGVVHQLAVHTIGGVITGAEVLMVIVPDSDELQIEARLQPNSIDQVRIGQQALVRFSAFNQRTTPQLNGSVSLVSADITQDKQTNAPYYTVRVILT